MAEFFGLVKNLTAQLAGGGEDQRKGVSLATPPTGYKVGEGDVGDDWKAEGSRLPRACLCASHQVSPLETYRDGVLLDWGRLGIVASLYVGVQAWAQVNLHNNG